MKELLRSALVIARRDYVATVWSKTFLLFLIGPLFPILFGVVFGTVGAKIDREAARPIVGVVSDQETGRTIADARARLAGRLGDGRLPDLRLIARGGDPHRLLTDPSTGITAVLTGGLDTPTLTGGPTTLDRLDGGMGLILDEARQSRALGPGAPMPVAITKRLTAPSAGTDNGARLLTARTAQLVLLMLTMILAGMLLSNLIEEKSNKVIEVLAAAVPVDAIFFGKIVSMLAISLVGVTVWLGHRGIVRHQHAAAGRGDDLVAIERIDAGSAKTAAGTALVTGPQRFSRVFQHRHAVALAQRQQGVHVGALPIQVDQHHAARQAVFPPRPFERALQCCRRHVPAAGLGVDEHRTRVAIRDCVRRRRESE